MLCQPSACASEIGKCKLLAWQWTCMSYISSILPWLCSLIKLETGYPQEMSEKHKKQKI